MKPFTALLLFLLGGCPLTAEDRPASVAIRFIPIGILPTWNLPDGHLLHQRNLPFDRSLPPRLISLRSDQDSEKFPLHLREISQKIVLSSKSEKLLAIRYSENAGEIWFSQKMPSAPVTLGVLSQANDATAWDQPNLLFLDDSEKAFPAQKIRFVNLSDQLVMIQIGDWTSPEQPPIRGILPGKTFIRDLKVGLNQVRIGYHGPGGAKRWIWSHQLRLRKNQRIQTFCYEARDKNPRQMVLFHHIAEDLPASPK